MRGKFITLEGLDGAGKSTHLKWLAAFLEHRSIPVRVTREPGGTDVGERLRQLLLDRDQRMHPETETLLMFAARREHLDKVIAPALKEGTWILCDRFTDATFAYQSGGSGVSWARIAALEEWVQDGLQPDITIFFDVSPEVGRQRSARMNKVPDRFEQEKGGFFDRVRQAYLQRAHENPARIHVVDAGGTVDIIQKQLENIIITMCK